MKLRFIPSSPKVPPINKICFIDFIIIKIEDKKEYVSIFDLDKKVDEVIKFKTNNQLDQFSSMYFNKLKKDLLIYGL